MAVNLSIKNVPETLAEKLRQRADANHRSLQGELMALLESSLAVPRANQEPAAYVVSGIARADRGTNGSAPASAVQSTSTTSLRQIWDQARAERRHEGPSSVELLREMRDDRSAHLMKLIDAPDAYARARALLALPEKKATKPKAGAAATIQPTRRKSGGAGQPRRAAKRRANHG